MRLSPRVKTTIPVWIDSKLTQSDAIITDLSIEGAFIQNDLTGTQVGDSVFLKYNLPHYGNLEHSGRAIRKDQNGVAINFYQLDISAKGKLWKYIANQLDRSEACPYCGEKYEVMPQTCRICGWKLSFDSPSYFEYHEKMYLLKKVYSKTEKLEPEQIWRMINFIDKDILKEEGSEEFQEFVGTSEVIKEVFSKIRKVAPTDIPVLILGESGTGKELTALAIHERSTRKKSMFVPINCAAIPETLLEAELFGYEKGAFTGAYTSRKGKFEHADGGTIFLDEIGDLSPALQAKLLRFLEDQIVERIGAISGKKVNVRLIAATNSDLMSAISGGRFRTDLYYRLEAFTIHLPPIRERGEDKLVLGKYFLNKFSREMGSSKTYTKDALKAIEDYNWPGNVREMINKVRRAIVMSNDHFIRPQDLELEAQEETVENRSSLKDVRKNIEKEKIKETLEKYNHNISKAARVLGISRPTFYSLKKKYNI